MTTEAATTTKWEFTAEFDLNVAIPETIKPQSRNSPPFVPMFFKPALSGALAGSKPHKFVPKSFFVDRAAKPELVTGGYMKSKVRDQFNKWVKTLDAGIRGGLSVALLERTGTEEDYRELGPGLSIWLIYAAGPKAPAA